MRTAIRALLAFFRLDALRPFALMNMAEVFMIINAQNIFTVRIPALSSLFGRFRLLHSNLSLSTLGA